MYTLAIVVGICFAIGFILTFEENARYWTTERYGEIAGTLFATFLISCVVGMLFGTIVAILIEDGVQNKVVIMETRDLETVKDSGTIGGDFFIGTGNIEGGMSYVFYVGTEDGGYKMEVVDSDYVVVYQDGKNVVETMGKMCEDKYINWTLGCNDPEFTGYYIHVPIGTIIKDMTLDAQ